MESKHFERDIYKVESINSLLNSLSLMRSIRSTQKYLTLFGCSSLENKYVPLSPEVTHNVSTRWAKNLAGGLVNLGPVTVFSETKITSSSRNDFEKIGSTHTDTLGHMLQPV